MISAIKASIWIWIMITIFIVFAVGIYRDVELSSIFNPILIISLALSYHGATVNLSKMLENKYAN